MNPNGLSPLVETALTSSKNTKRARAKHACRKCNARRVRCNVTEIRPCSNCKASGVLCEVLPSRRGKYNRATTTKRQSDEAARTVLSPSTKSADVSASLAPALSLLNPRSLNACFGDDYRALESTFATTEPSFSCGLTIPATLFCGESNLLTLTPGSLSQDEEPKSADESIEQETRLQYPIQQTPRSTSEHGHESSGKIKLLSTATSRYLQGEGALALPHQQACISAFQAYFQWFHPCFPILDRLDFTRKLATSQAPILLLQSMLFISASYCDDVTITTMGFSDRVKAKSQLYTRARLLFHADLEKDRTTLIQSLFLLSFWRGGPSDVRDVRYWLGVVIGLAESHGLHRSTEFATKDPSKARIRKRIWWSIYVRERQSSAALGLSSRVRDDDCDVEPLCLADLESEFSNSEESLFGTCRKEHVYYAIHMVKLAQILGRIVDLHIAPARQPSTPEQLKAVNDALQKWKQCLPEEMEDTMEEGSASIWSSLLHFGYNHLRILLHRPNFMKSSQGHDSGHIVAVAAAKISRVAEDMLAQGTLRYGQIHTITSLFAGLCIHMISLKRNTEVLRRVAESRAQMCLLGLQEMQRYWTINNNVLDLFHQHLDVSKTYRLSGAFRSQSVGRSPSILATEEQQSSVSNVLEDVVSGDLATPQTYIHGRDYEDQFLSLLYGPWEGDESTQRLESMLQTDDPVWPRRCSTLDQPL